MDGKRKQSNRSKRRDGFRRNLSAAGPPILRNQPRCNHPFCRPAENRNGRPRPLSWSTCAGLDRPQCPQLVLDARMRPLARTFADRSQFSGNRKETLLNPKFLLAHSNNVLGSPDCRMIDIKVPIRSSLWSGTGTVVVSPLSTRCISMWLPLRLTSENPCAASIAQTS